MKCYAQKTKYIILFAGDCPHLTVLFKHARAHTIHADCKHSGGSSYVCRRVGKVWQLCQSQVQTPRRCQKHKSVRCGLRCGRLGTRPRQRSRGETKRITLSRWKRRQLYVKWKQRYVSRRCVSVVFVACDVIFRVVSGACFGLFPSNR